MSRIGLLITSLLFFSAILLSQQGTALASLSIRPAYVETELGQKNIAEAVTVTNETDAEQRVRARVTYFDYSPEGAVRLLESGTWSLAPAIKLSPREFSIPPKESRVVRMAIIPPRDMVPGEYWAAVEFEPLTGSLLAGEDEEGRDVSIELISMLLIPVIGTYGTPIVDMELNEVQATRVPDGIRIRAHVSNTGTGRVRLRGEYTVLNSTGEVVGKGQIGEHTLLPDGDRWFQARFGGELDPSEDYSVSVVYTAPGVSDPVEGHVRVTPAETDN